MTDVNVTEHMIYVVRRCSEPRYLMHIDNDVASARINRDNITGYHHCDHEIVECTMGNVVQ
jgi:hypothetical protein